MHRMSTMSLRLCLCLGLQLVATAAHAHRPHSPLGKLASGGKYAPIRPAFTVSTKELHSCNARLHCQHVKHHAAAVSSRGRLPSDACISPSNLETSRRGSPIVCSAQPSAEELASVGERSTTDSTEAKSAAATEHAKDAKGVVASEHDAESEVSELTEPQPDGSTVWRLVVLALTIVWASNFATIKFVFGSLPDLHASQYAAIRFSIAALALLPFFLRGSSEARQGGLEIGGWICLGYFGQAVGLQTTTANKSAFICSLHVIWVAILSAFSKKFFEVRAAVSAVAAVSGVGFLELAGATPPVIGDLWSMSQPLGFGTGYVRLEQLMEKFPEEAPTVSAAKVLVVGVMAMLWATVEGGGNPNLPIDSILANPAVVAAFLWTGLITTALSIAIESYAFRYVPATDAAIILASEPLWAAAIAFAAIGEELGVNDIFGGLLVISACVLNEVSKSSLPEWITKKVSIGDQGDAKAQ
mmetsp:Transcript_42589/g.88980  ORF Transcript_42589/g.88980 Transcript_42589/m.88980 type:complete len:471 (-) Transcript_42589:349-1761(-)